MRVQEMIHIPAIALISLIFTYFWNLKVKNRVFRSPYVWGATALGALFSTWGLDVLMQGLEAESYYDSVQISAGVWLVFILATNLKYGVIYSLPRRDFWADYGGDLLALILAGVLIYAKM